MIKKTIEPTGDVCVKFTEEELAEYIRLNSKLATALKKALSSNS